VSQQDGWQLNVIGNIKIWFYINKIWVSKIKMKKWLVVKIFKNLTYFNSPNSDKYLVLIVTEIFVINLIGYKSHNDKKLDEKY